MGFRAASGRNAIVEVAFAVGLSRAWRPSEIQNIIAAHELWKELLPRVSPTQAQQVTFGPEGVSGQVVLTPGVVFESFKPDGNHRWRLVCEQQNLVVNCLEYTSWAEIWGQVRGLLRMVINAGAEDDQQIMSLGLQYIDDFIWDDAPEAYDIGQLLKPGSDLIPTGLAARGRVWHLHQGWFAEAGDGHPGTVLNRVNIDALPELKPRVRVDTLHRRDLTQPQPLTTIVDEATFFDTSFEALHSSHRDLICGLLVAPVRRAIGLKG